ncbi:protein of unknown function [uncultured Sphingopyxis sp.]|uniref:Uncharacterized protein n=1 Tax=uncultured Sphingopyxis sp. TaxID=310581 RepID=A0A1Y5PMC2_9SPHN|nr:protein of unknown function [uncultured Sphingopyxis sp.]
MRNRRGPRWSVELFTPNKFNKYCPLLERFLRVRIGLMALSARKFIVNFPDMMNGFLAKLLMY